MGKRSAVLLTKRIVDAARPDHERYHVWDSELSGFGLRIVPTGVKIFIGDARLKVAEALG